MHVFSPVQKKKTSKTQVIYKEEIENMVEKDIYENAR